MTIIWPVPRSRIESSPYVPETASFGGPAAAADLVRLGVLTPLFDGAFGLPGTHTPQVRALAVALYVSNGAVVGLESAAWIYTGMGHLRKVFVWQSRSRHRLPPHRRRIVRSRELSPDEVAYVAGVPVTTPEVTLRDLTSAAATPRRPTRSHATPSPTPTFTTPLPDLITALTSLL